MLKNLYHNQANTNLKDLTHIRYKLLKLLKFDMMHSKQQQQQHHFQMRYKIFPVFSFSFSFCQIEIQKRQNHHRRRKLFGQNQKKKI